MSSGMVSFEDLDKIELPNVTPKPLRVQRYNATELAEHLELNEVLLRVTATQIPNVHLSYEGPWLAGGFLTRLLAGEDTKAGDVDLFFPNADAVESAIAAFVFHQNIRITNRKKHVVTLECKDPAGVPSAVQLITTDKKTPQELIADFDYTVCQLAFDGNNIYVGDYTLADLYRKRLAVNKVINASSMVKRMIRYTQRGYTANHTALDKIYNAVRTGDEEAVNDFFRSYT